MYVIKTAQNEYAMSLIVTEPSDIDVLTTDDIDYAARFTSKEDANHVIQHSWLIGETCWLVVVADYESEDDGYVFNMSELEVA